MESFNGSICRSFIGRGSNFVNPHYLTNPFYEPIVKFSALVTDYLERCPIAGEDLLNQPTHSGGLFIWYGKSFSPFGEVVYERQDITIDRRDRGCRPVKSILTLSHGAPTVMRCSGLCQGGPPR